MKPKSQYTYSTISTGQIKVISPSSLMRLKSICIDAWANPRSLFGNNYLANREQFSWYASLRIRNTRVKHLCGACYTCVCFCMWRPEVDIRNFPQLLLHFILKQVSYLIRLVNQPQGSSCFSLPNAKIAGMFASSLLVQEIQTKIFMLAQQTLYWVNHLPSPNSEFLTV